MRLGVQLPEVERLVRWPEYVAMARAAEESGFDSVWLGDHLLYRDDGREERGPWDAWSLLAALARGRWVAAGRARRCHRTGPHRPARVLHGVRPAVAAGAASGGGPGDQRWPA